MLTERLFRPTVLIGLAISMLAHLGSNQEDCSYYPTEPRGNISSLNFPLNYSNLANCFWLIQVHEDNFIILNFSTIRTECGYDYVSVYDGSGELSPRLGWYCDQPNGVVVTSTSNTMYVTFTSDSMVTSQGFQAVYTSMLRHLNCMETLTSIEGVFQTPYFPYNYSNNANCAWLIQAPEDYIIQLRFQTLLAECGFDYVRVFDGTDASARRMADFCHQPDGVVLVSSSNTMYVSFTSDTAATNQGFYANYTSLVRIKSCNETLTNLTGGFTSPYYPLYYGNNQDCAWFIEVPVGYFISLSFTYLDTECGFDYVAVYDGNSTDARLLGPYCTLRNGTELNLQSASNSFYVTFTSSSYVTKRGFEAYYVSCLESYVKWSH